MQRKDSSSALKASGDGAGVTAAKKQDDSESREGGNTLTPRVAGEQIGTCDWTVLSYLSSRETVPTPFPPCPTYWCGSCHLLQMQHNPRESLHQGPRKPAQRVAATAPPLHGQRAVGERGSLSFWPGHYC